MTDKELVEQLNKLISSPNYHVEYHGERLRKPMSIRNKISGEISSSDLRFHFTHRVYITGFDEEVVIRRLSEPIDDWRHEEIQ